MSLVEIMIAMLLSLVLLSGVGQVYLGSKQSYRMQDGQSRLQENGRYALEVLNRDIRSAGYTGCLSASASAGPTVIGNSLLAPNAAPFISGGENNAGSWSNPYPALSHPIVSDAQDTPNAVFVVKESILPSLPNSAWECGLGSLASSST